MKTTDNKLSKGGGGEEQYRYTFFNDRATDATDWPEKIFWN